MNQRMNGLGVTIELQEPFYDRSWQVEVVGPISSNIGSGDWASLVVSNFWHQSMNAGGQISVDGLNITTSSSPVDATLIPDWRRSI